MNPLQPPVYGPGMVRQTDNAHEWAKNQRYYMVKKLKI